MAAIRRVRMSKDSAVCVADIDQCAFQTPYSKATRIMFFNCGHVEAAHLRCHAVAKRSSYSDKKHRVLAGLQKKEFATLAAAEYSDRLATRLVIQTVQAAAKAETKKWWEVMTV